MSAKTKHKQLLFLVCAMVFCGEAFGGDIYPKDGETRITIPVGQKTVLQFETAIKTVTNANKFVIEPVDSQSPDYAMLTIEPRVSFGEERATFFFDDGNAMKLRIAIVPALKNFDGYYRFKSKKLLGEQRQRIEGASKLTKLQFIKALILGEPVFGYDMREVNKPIETDFKGVNAKLLKVYTGGDLIGYVYELENTTRFQKYRVDIRRLKLGKPNLAILSSIDRNVLEGNGTPRSKALLAIVAKPSSTDRDVILPVSWIKQR